MEVHHPNAQGHAEAWEAIIPPQGATPKQKGPYPKLEGPDCSVWFRHPNSVAKPMPGNPSSQLEGPHQSVGVHHPNSKGLTEAWESIRSGPNLGKVATLPLPSWGSPTTGQTFLY